MSELKSPFAPMQLPPDTLRRVGSYRHTDGRVLGIYRLPKVVDPDDNGPLAWQEPMDKLFDIDVTSVTVQPMPVPSSRIFYMDYEYDESKK